ncbi:MAG: T9SS type A sorting domain-containing protein [Fluviicola sp.]
MRLTNTLLAAVCCFVVTTINAQITAPTWQVNYQPQRAFVENKGQFDMKATAQTGEILFAAHLPNLYIYFGEEGISYHFRTMKMIPKEEREAIMEAEVSTLEEYKLREEMHGKVHIREDVFNMQWQNISNNVELIVEDTLDAYRSYSITDYGPATNYNYCRQFEKLMYKNLYPNIDVVYEIHPQSGVKYSIYVHPGADIGSIEMLYDRTPEMLNGELHFETEFGPMIDHKPYTFNEQSNDYISSNYSLNGNLVSFQVANYNPNETIVIDPWTQSPNFNLDWDCIWELDHDAAGNVYIIGGVDNMELLKYNAAGTLQWTHTTPYDTTAWLGTMATDDAGNTYVTNGTSYEIQKVSTTGALLWDNPNPTGSGIGLSTEFWNITFNCDQSRLLVGGSGGNLDIHGRVYDIDMNTGNSLASMQLTAAGPLFSIPPALQEVRAMCSAPNGKYYFVTLDTIGYFSDNLNLCTGNTTSLIREDHGVGWGYKAENWRYNNTGIKALRVDSNAIYVNRGSQIQKRDLNTFAILATANIPNGTLQSVFLGGNQSHNAGIDIDDCGDVYVGSTDGVYHFDSNLNQLAFYATPAFKVWDVQVTPNGDVIACGGTGTSGTGTRTGGVALFNGVACNPIAINCCDASWCIPEPLCDTAAAITLITATPGGTWSGTGVNASGVFDPGVAGVGNHTITYTLPCGSETHTISVVACNSPLTVCEESDGTLTASGGGGSYSWYDGSSVTNTTNITDAASCTSCGGTPQFVFGIFYSSCEDSGGNTINSCTTTTFTWNATPYATGSNTAAPSSYPIVVYDAVGDSVVINSAAELTPCSTIPLSSDLAKYEVNCSPEGTIIKWITHSETDVDYFLVERMIQGETFESLVEVPGSGTSSSQLLYEWIDRDLNTEGVYYRLSSVDLNGTKTILGSRYAACSESTLKAYPNPFSSTFTLELGGAFVNIENEIAIYDAFGNQVYSTIFKGNQSSIDVNLGGLASGMYLIRVNNAFNSETVRLIKK